MIDLTPLSGLKYDTEFTVTISPSAETVMISWGDGTYSNTSTAYHTYSANNIYNVLVGSCGETSAFSVSASMGDFLENKIKITYDSLTGLATCPKTFTINLSSLDKFNTVYLYSSGSNSVPYVEDRNFWSHLNPEWKFTDSNDKPISEITLEGTPQYFNNMLIGYICSSAVSYTDDLPGHTNLFFTQIIKNQDLQINSRIYSSLYYAISSLVPDKLLITSDGITPINEIQWADLNNPYLISVYSSDGCKNIVHNASGYFTSVKITSECNGIDAQLYTVPTSSIVLTDIDCFPIGGYLRTSFYVPASALPDNELTNNCSCIDKCDPKFRTIDETEFTQKRYVPVYTTISATGIFDVNGTIYSLSGISNAFNVYRLENFHQFYRKGEEKTIYDLLNRYSPNDLNQFPKFDEYLNAIAGQGDTLGKSWDKITNFAKDHADIDICTIDNIHDKATKMDVLINDFGLEMPEELKRMMNLFSIPLPKLIGTRCVCNTNFANCENCCGKNICSVCKFDKRSNIGEALTLNDYVTAGQTILYKDAQGDIFNFLPIFEQDNQTTYKLNTLTGGEICSRGFDKYCFFKWDQTKQGNPVEGIIDYLNPQTLIDRDLTTEEDWYKENGVIEETLNYILTKNLIK